MLVAGNKTTTESGCIAIY